MEPKITLILCISDDLWDDLKSCFRLAQVFPKSFQDQSDIKTDNFYFGLRFPSKRILIKKKKFLKI